MGEKPENATENQNKTFLILWQQYWKNSALKLILSKLFVQC